MFDWYVKESLYIIQGLNMWYQAWKEQRMRVEKGDTKIIRCIMYI